VCVCVCDIKIRYCIYLNKSEFYASGRKMAAVTKVGLCSI
jgi:hypothetical protein